MFVHSTVRTTGTVYLEILQQNISEQDSITKMRMDIGNISGLSMFQNFVESYSFFDKLISENVG